MHSLIPSTELHGTANSDEGTAFMTRGINFDSDLVNAILARNSSVSFLSMPVCRLYIGFTANYAFTSAADVQQILQLYPDDPAQGVPIGTGDGILSTGFQDKRVSSLSLSTWVQYLNEALYTERGLLRRRSHGWTPTCFCPGECQRGSYILVQVQSTALSFPDRSWWYVLLGTFLEGVSDHVCC